MTKKIFLGLGIMGLALAFALIGPGSTGNMFADGDEDYGVHIPRVLPPV